MDANGHNEPGMTEPASITATTTWRSRLLSRSRVSALRYENHIVFCIGADGQTPSEIPVESIRMAVLSPGPMNNGLVITTEDGREIYAGGLDKEASWRIHETLSRDLEAIQGRRAAENARQAAPRITAMGARLREVFSPDRYTRHSEAVQVNEEVRTVFDECDEPTEARLSSDAKHDFALIRNVVDPDGRETKRRGSNEEFLRRMGPLVRTATQDILPNGVTQEQAMAIATDEDCTLVLAGAGTGKTAVIIGKIAHLVRNQGVDPGAILALAFNRKAALEVRERLPEDLKGATVSTFHSFGLRVIAEAGTAPTVSKLASDDFSYGRAMDDIVQGILHDHELSRTALELIGSMPAEYRSPFDFQNPAEYEQYVRDVELRALSGDLVKSFEELTIANFLTENGIKFRYEERYEVETADSRRRQYRPDFHLPWANIYIEHFAVNEDGQPPPGWTRYLDDMAWKRRIHRDNGSTLVETYSWQHRGETLLETLRSKLGDLGVQFQPVPTEELVARLSGERINWLAHLLGQFINHVKSGNLSDDDMQQRAADARDRKRTEKFLEVFRHTWKRYEELLKADEAIDFHDLINQAVAVIEAPGWQNPFTHVLVDEFQDISSGRMALLKALGKDGLSYFLVGDDWQSIYRFTGSQVGLVHDCDRHLGNTERRALTRTFRFGEGILEPSGRFIQQNPEQTKRKLTTEREGEGIIVMSSLDRQEGLNQAVREILERNEGRRPYILILARYRNRTQLVRGLWNRVPAHIEFSTAHAAKGREAEYVIVVDLFDGRYGFPCTTEDDPLLELVLPPVSGQAFPHAEERRLFYVAMTRAVRAAYLITDPEKPSPFVRELLKNSPEVENRGELAPSCPDCPRGSLIPSASRDNLRCSNYPGCGHMIPLCPRCRRGYVTIQEGTGKCSNPGCAAPPMMCPRCGNGILVPRTGNNPFWGCSRYHSEPSCTYTARRNP